MGSKFAWCPLDSGFRAGVEYQGHIRSFTPERVSNEHGVSGGISITTLTPRGVLQRCWPEDINKGQKVRFSTSTLEAIGDHSDLLMLSEGMRVLRFTSRRT